MTMDGFHPDMQAWAERIQEQRRQRETRQAAEASRISQAAVQRANALYDEMQKMGERITGAGA